MSFNNKMDSEKCYEAMTFPRKGGQGKLTICYTSQVLILY